MISSESPLRFRPTQPFTKFEADCCINTDPDAVQRMVNDPENNMFLAAGRDESTLSPVSKRWSFVDDICFSGRSLKDCLATFNILLELFIAFRISVRFTNNIFIQPRVSLLSHKVNAQRIAADTDEF